MSSDAQAAFTASFMADALEAVIVTEPVSPDQVAAIDGAGNPETGTLVLGEFAGREVGVWEMTPGAMTDVEVDEFCVILAGAGEVHRSVNGAQVIQTLQPGVVLQLRDGEETLWVVERTLRKVYLA
jgi:uncharacterized cupin superfamily protein